MKLPHTLSLFRQRWNLNASNLLTFTNPKVMKSQSIAPTAVLHLLPTGLACPGAGSCKALCLNTAGNPAYLKGKLACRQRRHDAFMTDPELFMQNLLIELVRFYQKNRGNAVLGVRLNGTSDYKWEHVPVEVTLTMSAYLYDHFDVELHPRKYGSLMEAFEIAYDPMRNSFLSDVVYFYDYTKRPDRDWQKCWAFNYHLTISHGGKFDLLPLAIEHKLNYAAALDLRKSQPLPESVVVHGKQLQVVDGDVTDWRPGDPSGKTHLVALRIKRTPGQTQEMRDAFCLPVQPVRELVAA